MWQNTKSTQRSVTFLYTNKTCVRKEIEKTIPFTIVSERIKYFGINVTKEVKDFTLKITKHY